ncbi:DNA double-strand break repair nuclease NurA [Anaerosalibacter massiliensis]|uniref:DNA double-strand break repair nuclease NurA n=1 Tax=Anaerosalibacter massiliensis TaxID=1347392 RepID=A0A9X2MIF2_9FIRM|nr:DNA double-strand break repair nuclease NurA [Anaerosalibacter massiliensis]MCR2044239.1 DNA double-strand break repair nuclease NurA [Anaerosalibacter massiliensis]
MYEISKELKEKVVQLNSTLLEKYKDFFNMDEYELRDFIDENIGKIIKIEKLSKDELNKCYKNGGIVGVDGSRNRVGGAYPHYVEIYQGLAKSTIYEESPIFKADYYTPLYLEGERDLLKKFEEEENKEEAIRDYKLSSIEVEVALEAVKEFNPYAIMMDGSLIRYDIECFDKWIELRQECERRNIVLIGVIKDIKTSIIGQNLIEEKQLDVKEFLYDREILYGLLKYGEIIKIEDKVAKKSKEGFTSIFMRSSEAPNIIGMDILDNQREYLDEMARLVLSLTPSSSRGVPLWLDIVDSQVKISDKMVEGLLGNYLDRQVFEKFFISERDKRTL